MAEQEEENPSLQMLTAIRATAHTLLVLSDEMGYVARDCEYLNAINRGMPSHKCYRRHMDTMQEILRQLNNAVSDAVNFLETTDGLTSYQEAIMEQGKRQTALALSANAH